MLTLFVLTLLFAGFMALLYKVEQLHAKRKAERARLLFKEKHATAVKELQTLRQGITNIGYMSPENIFSPTMIANDQKDREMFASDAGLPPSSLGLSLTKTMNTRRWDAEEEARVLAEIGGAFELRTTATVHTTPQWTREEALRMQEYYATGGEGSYVPKTELPPKVEERFYTEMLVRIDAPYPWLRLEITYLKTDDMIDILKTHMASIQQPLTALIPFPNAPAAWVGWDSVSKQWISLH